MIRMLPLALLSMLLTSSSPMIMRNNALMTKMVSQFQGKDNNRSPREPRINKESLLEVPSEMPDQPHQHRQHDNRDVGSSRRVLSLMQNVLCNNFPSVPCEIITKDITLRNLIEKSIQQLKYKKMSMERTTHPPIHQLTLFPVINSEELSNYLQVSNTGFFKPKKTQKKTIKMQSEKNFWAHEARNNSQTSLIGGRKKIRKFYPHKIKYKDKSDKRDLLYSDEKLSMSVETPIDHSANVKRRHFSYRGEPSDPPVWRIDYMKHGEPSLNMFGYESDALKGKIIKTGPNVVVDDNILEQAARRDVLHPDVYIKKNYPRQTFVSKDNSENIEQE